MKEPVPKGARHFYSFGPYRLYVAEREVFRAGEPVNLGPKAVDALLTLVSHHGHVVDKHDLMTALWPDTFVEEDSLVKQISHLRKVLGDGADGTPYIETVPTRGYRFSACVTESWEEEELTRGPALVEPDRTVTAVMHHCRKAVYPAVAIALSVIGLLALYFLRMATARSSEIELRPLTCYQGHEGWPSFSPDGSQVAFSWRREGREDFDLYVKAIGSDNPLQLTSAPDWDIGPAWSPDGRQIAFNRSRRDGKSGIYVVSPSGGPERLVTELRAKGPAYWWPTEKQSCPKMSWSPDGRWLAVQDEELYLLSLATGEKRVLTSPSPGWAYQSSPAFSPDGQSLAFARWKSAGSLADVYTISTSGGKPKRITMDEREIFGLCWTANGREIVFSSTRSGEPALWRVPVSGGAPRRVLEAGQQAWFPSVSLQGSYLAFTRQLSDLNIWRVEAPGDGGAARKPVKLIASTKTEMAPEFSPDGKRIGFTSDRSGTMQVWVCDQDGSNPLQLTFLPGPGAEHSAWSPDGRSIAFHSASRGNWDIYLIAAEGGTARQLTAEGSNDLAPSWSRDGRWVYFSSNRTGRFEVWKVPPEGGAAVQVTRNGGFGPVESRDGRFVYYTKGRLLHDAWKIAAEGGQETPVLENLRSHWCLAEGGLCLFEQEPDGRWFLKFFDFATGRKKPVTALAGTPVSGPAVSPDGRSFLYVGWDLAEADLVLVENFR